MSDQNQEHTDQRTDHGSRHSGGLHDDGQVSVDDKQESGDVREASGGCKEKRRRVDSGSGVTLPQKISTPGGSTSSVFHQSVAASPPRFISLDEIMKMTNGVTDLSLAHELAVNDDFRLETSTPRPDSLEGQIRNVVSKAFWDMLEEKLNDESDDHSYSIKLLEDVKASLLDLLLPQHVRLRAEIESTLDLSLIKQQAEHEGHVDFRHYADYVIQVMSTLCAPVRDEQIEQLRQQTDILTLYKQMCDLLAQMKLDMVNFTISQLRPVLKQHTSEVERQKFNALLETQKESGVDGLEVTRNWLRRHYVKLNPTPAAAAVAPQATAAEVSSDKTAAATAGGIEYVPGEAAVTAASSSSSSNCANAVTLTAAGPVTSAQVSAVVRKIINSAYIELLDWEEGEAYPETLLVDTRRLLDLTADMLLITLTASVLALTYSTVGVLIRDLQEFKTTLKQQVVIILESSCSNAVHSHPQQMNTAEEIEKKSIADCLCDVAEQVCQLTTRSLEDHGYAQPTPEQLKVLRGQVQSLALRENPIRRVMRLRVCGFLLDVLSGASRSVQLPAGFTALEEELRRLCERFLRLVSYNYSVYSPHYVDIINGFSTSSSLSSS